ncbi:MAG: hypothetical protein H6734_02285 [Alphaproteobacteria bacterium]|nr:hypothetical protein [Alphaproteobacteria bacterium]
MPHDPRKPDLPELPEEPDDALVPLDPGAPEPAGELHFIEEALHPEEDMDLLGHEPDGTPLDTLDLGSLLDPLDGLELEDFATQEELPALPWSLDVLLLEPGHSVPAQLEPTLARTVLERPGGGEPFEVTLRIRMLDLRLVLPVADAPAERLRVGRDVLAGRILVRVDG